MGVMKEVIGGLGVRYQVSGFRDQVSGVRGQGIGVGVGAVGRALP